MKRSHQIFFLSTLVVGISIVYNSYGNSMNLDVVKARNAAAAFPGLKAMVVGGTSGIGESIAMRLAQAQFDVIIVGRNENRGNAVVQAMQAKNPNGKYTFLPLDAQYIKNIQGLANKFTQLDRLVLTQGIATIQGRTETSEGLDQKMALHFYSRMAFIQEFLPLLRTSQHNPKVLSVLSGGIHSPYAKFQEDPELKENYSLQNAADAAGFYNDLMLDAFSKDPANQAIAFGHSAPGFVATNWGTEMPWAIRMLLRPAKLFAKSKEDCGEFMSDFLLQPTPTTGFHPIDQYGEATKTTKSHTPEAVEFIQQHTTSTIDRILSQ
ncbi:FabG domain-containing protein [Thraustotheca clavata]|uniref:FabG domain-containing protein n=1 Tax=Thraustotheca clavata TaxID=74557 RepID=A0A1V9Y5C2_9STRA|nr:FabG domain-containing protein [Thraustotheca clavata]